ncbi:MAG: hypothetical protein RBU30_17835 [Polyangia bacterium]|jgi:hypothetical protein|nr:hypothetical protein [Polyangia bacterium]
MRKTLIPAILVTLFAAGACSQDDLGRYCFVGAEGGGDDIALTILNTEAPECGARLCLKQGGYQCPEGERTCLEDVREKLQPMCTQECKANKDCEKTSDNVNDCTKYVCQAQGEETGFGDHCICVCLDFLRDSDGNPITEEAFNSASNDYSPCSPK